MTDIDHDLQTPVVGREQVAAEFENEALDEIPAVEERQAGVIGLVLLVSAFLALGVLVSWYLVVMLLSLVVIMFLHELGHYVTAKRAGMKVTEFFIGFGPRIWSFRRGETTYGVKGIWAGAYVKIIGMNNLEEVDPDEEQRTYRAKSFPRKLSVAVAGSFMHFVLAILLLFVAFAFRGEANFDDWVVESVSVDSGASAAGIEPGDRIAAIDGERFSSFSTMVTAIKNHQPGDVVDIELVRDGKTQSVSATLGERVDERTGDKVASLGIAQGPSYDDFGVFEAMPRAVGEFGFITGQSVQALGTFFTPSNMGDFFSTVINADIGEEASLEESQNRPVSIVGATRLGEQAAAADWWYLVGFLVVLNVFFGIFNLVPLLPLDGGHVIIAVYERIRSRKGRRYTADIAKMIPLTYGVVAFLVVFGLSAIYLDIANPIVNPFGQ